MTGGGSGVRSEINITPLVDVVLVLLIIFMVVTPMLQRGINVDLPKAKHVASAKDAGDPMIVAVKSDGTVWIEKTQVTLEQLQQQVADIVKSDPTKRVLVKGDKAALYGKVRVALDRLSKAGATGVSLAAEENKPSGGAPAAPAGGH